MSAIAIAWTLAWPGVTGAIVGARTPQQVDGWIDAAFIAAPQDVEEIASAIRDGRWHGTNRPRAGPTRIPPQ